MSIILFGFWTRQKIDIYVKFVSALVTIGTMGAVICSTGQKITQQWLALQIK